MSKMNSADHGRSVIGGNAVQDRAIRDLHEYHEELNKLLNAIEVETSRMTPEIGKLSNTRLLLTRISKKRTALLLEIIDKNIASVSSDFRTELEQFRRDLFHARLASAAHIGKWTTQSIGSDWHGYKMASDKIRKQMRSQIDREAKISSRLLISRSSRA